MNVTWKEWFLFIVVTLMSISANLPEDIAGQLGINPLYMLLALSVTVTVALLRYLNFLLFLSW